MKNPATRRRAPRGLRALGAAGVMACALAGSASPARAAKPAVLCLVNPQPLDDQSGGFEWRDTLARLKRDAETVCAALGSRPDALDQPFDERELLAKLATLPADGPRIVFYAGHGLRNPGTNEVSLPLKGKTTVRLSKVLAALDPGKRDTWSALIMNSCQSAYADLRGVNGHVVVMGSGWDKVSADPNRGDDPESLTRFGAALAAGLAGSADAPPVGNCDGVVTDGEISRFIDEEMARAARKNVELWRMAPVAAIRRNRAVDVPLRLLPQADARCRAPERAPPAAPPPLEPFAKRIASVERLREGAAPQVLPPLVAVAVSPADALADDVWAGLTQIAQNTGIEIVRVDPAERELVKSWAWKAAALPIYLLEISDAGTSERYLELVRARDRATTWATFAPRGQPASALVTLIAPALPRSLRVLHHFARATGQLRVTDGWSEKDVLEATDWSSLAGGRPSWTQPELKGLHPDACPDFAGLCFDVPTELAKRLEPLFLRRHP